VIVRRAGGQNILGIGLPERKGKMNVGSTPGYLGSLCLQPASSARRLTSRLPAIFPPLLRGSSEKRSLRDHIKSPDFRVKLPETIQVRPPKPPNPPPMDWLSAAISNVASAPSAFIARERQVFALRRVSRAFSAAWLFPATKTALTVAIRGSGRSLQVATLEIAATAIRESVRRSRITW